MGFNTAFALVLCLYFCNAQGFVIDNGEDGEGVNWALLIAGSAGYMNYRHQADICHAYQIMHNHGIPDERIVVMMFDDIANNPENPTKGILINHPDGHDVYHGVPKDYIRETVTPRNFLNVLQGKKDAMNGIGSGKVIASGPNDHVFVYFADHGAPGILGFPNDELNARPFINAIKSMHKDKKYKQMAIYIEACESGSMFKGLLPNDINVYAVTAANSQESSWACYKDDKRNTYLGDEFSVRWMEDSDREKLQTETLAKQFADVKGTVKRSHVQHFGDLKIAKEHVSIFQGPKPAAPFNASTASCGLPPTASGDVPLALASLKMTNAKDVESYAAAKQDVLKMIEERESIRATMKKVVAVASSGNDQLHQELLTERPELTNFNCYEAAVHHFDTYCFNLSDHEYALRQLYLLVNLCEKPLSTDTVLQAIYGVCSQL